MQTKDFESKTTSDRSTETRDLHDVNRPDANPDAITGAPGSHPVGVGVGAAGGGLAGAAAGFAIGSVVPVVGNFVGGAIGAAVGAIGGGYAGKGVAESVNPTDEHAYWSENYKTRPYYGAENYAEYSPAYQYGWESRSNYPERSFDDVEPDLGRGWDKVKGESSLVWDRAKHATRDAWNRVEDKFKGRDDSSSDRRNADLRTSDRNPM